MIQFELQLVGEVALRRRKSHLTSFLGVLLVLAINPCRAESSSSLSGTWILDPDKSQSVSPGMKQTISITQKENTVDVETQTERNGKNEHAHETFILDGKTRDVPAKHFTLGIGGSARRTATPMSDATSFVVTDEGMYQTEFGPVSDLRKRTWALSRGGNTLTITTYLQSAVVEANVTRLYVRQ